MRREAYLAQNALGYEGDVFIHAELKKLNKRFNFYYAFETGTFRGATTQFLCMVAHYVHTIEIDNENFAVAEQFHRESKLFRVFNNLGNSPDVLNEILSRPSQPEWKDLSLLFYLDAHWENHCPLLDELQVIADHKLKPVIVIHDFKVPEHPEFGYDSYNGQDFDFAWIQPSIERIYGVDGYDYHYNLVAIGAKRGVIYIYPKQ
jgi:hypothetical protein